MEFQMELDMQLEMEKEGELEMEKEGELEMKLAGKTKKKRNTLEIMEDEYLNPRDRLSDLPEFIIHHIYSFLDYKDSGRAASVSWKFYRLWYTMPVLDFDTVRFPTMEFIYFIHKTMRRYLDDKIIVNKLRLNVKLYYEGVIRLDVDGMISNSVEIAVKNNVEILELSIDSNYHRMKLYELPEVVVSAKSLKFLKLQNLQLKDEMVESLIPRLPLLESLTLIDCSGLNCAKISSSSLERLRLEICCNLMKLEIEAPNLDSFCFSWLFYDNYPVLSFSKQPAQCTALLFQVGHIIKTCYFTRLREFLVLSKVFNVLKLSLSGSVTGKVEFKVDDVMEIPVGPPYELNELELKICNAILPESVTSAVLEGLLWCCHPKTVSTIPLSIGSTQCVENDMDEQDL